MNIFSETELRAVLDSHLADAKKEVHNEGKNKLLNVNEAEYIKYLVDKYWVESLVMQRDNVYVSEREVNIAAEQFPPNFNVYSGKSYPKQVITYHLPFTGDRELLRCRPSTRILWTTEVLVDRRANTISFDVVNWSDDSEQIKREGEDNLSRICKQAESVAHDVDRFNSSLESQITAYVRNRKEEHLKRSGLLADLGVPFKKSSDVPETFSIPTVKKRVVVKPSAPSSVYTPEPALDNSTYREILELCYHYGVEMERLPSTYSGKDEETLRDHFILILSPHFESVTAETFNRSGKTDILIRHEKANAFVAECKFWGGKKKLLNTINQALGYLTWRDSKAALLIFIKNKELDPVLSQIEPTMGEHPCFVRNRGRQQEGWYEFDFHLLDDSSRGVKLAVLCFHFPPLAD